MPAGAGDAVTVKLASVPSITSPSEATVSSGAVGGGVASFTATVADVEVACFAAPPSMCDADSVPNATSTDPSAVSESAIAPPVNVTATFDAADVEPVNVTVGVPEVRFEHATPVGRGDGHDTVY